VSVLKNNFRHIIETERLYLFAYELPHLLLWQESGQEQVHEKLSFYTSNWDHEPRYHSNNTEALENFWIPYVIDNLDNYLWFTNWDLVHKAHNQHIGHIGWGGFPSYGESELGYIMHQDYAGQSLTTEAIRGFLDYFRQYPYFQRALAQTDVTNVASQKVLLNNGFEIIQELEESEGLDQPAYLWAKNVR
jgi:[ribosomal protein S5]-alanine N-acetyltransferase